MRWFLVVGFFLSFFLGSSAANATVDVSIDLTHQRMNVTSASGSYSWPISSARAGYVTPRGVFHPQAMYRMTYSRIYDNAPMPHAIFFSGGYAIHGTTAVGSLGSPASHGCVRLAPGNAATLFQMVKAEGARITIGGAAPRVASAAHGKGAAARSGHGQGTRVARGTHGRETKLAAHKRGHGTKYARSSNGRSHSVVANAQPQPQAAPQGLLAFFGGTF